MRKFFKKLKHEFDLFMMSTDQRSEYLFLSEAKDLADLEWRQKALRNRPVDRCVFY